MNNLQMQSEKTVTVTFTVKELEQTLNAINLKLGKIQVDKKLTLKVRKEMAHEYCKMWLKLYDALKEGELVV